MACFDADGNEVPCPDSGGGSDPTAGDASGGTDPSAGTSDGGGGSGGSDGSGGSSNPFGGDASGGTDPSAGTSDGGGGAGGSTGGTGVGPAPGPSGGGGGAPPSSGGGSPSNGGGGGSPPPANNNNQNQALLNGLDAQLNALMAALTATNAQDFQEKVREFNVGQQNWLAQFNATYGGVLPDGGQTVQEKQRQFSNAVTSAGLTGYYTDPNAPWTPGGLTGPGGNWDASTQWDPKGYVVGSDGYIHNGSDGSSTGVRAPQGAPVGMTGATLGALANATAPKGQATLAEQQLSGILANGLPTEAAREFNINTQSDLAKLASSLSGPADYFKYLTALNGGQSILNNLFNGQAQPAGGAPVGSTQPQTLQNILAGLGLGTTANTSNSPGTTGGTTAPPASGGSTAPAAGGSSSGGQYTQSGPGAGTTVGGQNNQSSPGLAQIPSNNLASAIQGLKSQGNMSNTALQGFSTLSNPNMTENSVGGPTTSFGPGTNTSAAPNTNTGSGVQLPYGMGQLPYMNQIQPTAWNSFSNGAKQFIQGAYAAAGYDPSDIQRAIMSETPASAPGSGPSANSGSTAQSVGSSIFG